MDKQRLVELLTKRESGDMTLPEIRELKDYLKNHSEEQQLADLLEQVLSGTFKNKHSYKSQDINERIERIHKKIAPDVTNDLIVVENNRTNLKLILRSIAAVLVLALGLFYFYSNENKEQTASPNILTTRKGSKSSVVLPDGTRVLLNADTHLSYDQSFGKDLREVFLEGEAYFEVVKDSKRPFVVHTKTMNVKVLGTVFNVRAYKSEINTEATLLKGSIQVTLNKENDKNVVVLKPSEKIVVKNKEDETNQPKEGQSLIADLTVVPININKEDSSVLETGWTKNQLVFDQMYYSDVFAELERWYGVNVVVKDSSVLQRKISGIYENEAITEVLESFKLATGLKFDLNGNTLVVYK